MDLKLKLFMIFLKQRKKIARSAERNFSFFSCLCLRNEESWGEVGEGLKASED
jgi:hypothetical protein